MGLACLNVVAGTEKERILDGELMWVILSGFFGAKLFDQDVFEKVDFGRKTSKK
jgi:hypothetical protein